LMMIATRKRVRRMKCSVFVVVLLLRIMFCFLVLGVIMFLGSIIWEIDFFGMKTVLCRNVFSADPL
jgi:hypothetical protein